MKKIRAIWRLFAFTCVTVYEFILLRVGILRWGRQSLQFREWRRKRARAWASKCARVISLKITAQGTPPNPPFFLASNHLSYLDVVLYMSLTNCLFVSKAEISNWLLFGAAAETAGIIFVNRENALDVGRVTTRMEHALQAGDGIVLFPEATTSDGRGLLPLHSSLLEPSSRLNVPLHYASIRYQAPPGELSANDSICWWGDIEFFPHFWRLLQLSSLSATVQFGEQPLPPAPRKQLTKELRASLEQIFQPSG